MFGCWVITPQCIPRLFSSLLSRKTGEQERVNNSTGEFGHSNQSVAQVEARLSAITQLRHNDEHIYHSDTTAYVSMEVVSQPQGSLRPYTTADV